MLVKGDKRQQLNALQFYLDQDIAVANAEQIISVTAHARLTAAEALTGEAKAAYKVLYKIIYKSAEGIECHEESSDQNIVMKSSAILPKSHLDLSAAVIAVEYVGTTNLKVRLTVEVKGFTIVAYSFETPSIPEDIYTKTSSVPVEHIEPIKESEIIASNDFDLKEPIGKILTYDTQITLKKVATATEICEIRGECYTYITYLSEGNLSSKCLMTPFNTEILAPGVKEGGTAFCTARAQSTTLTMNGSGAIKTEIVVGIRGVHLVRQDVEFVTDAYSCTKELKIGYENAEAEDNVCISDATEKISGSARLASDKPRIRSILCVCPPSVGSVSVSNNGGLTAEGIVTVSVVYLDENEKISDELIELPYHFLLSRDFGCTSGLSASGIVTAISARARHNDEIEISGEICIEVYGATEKNYAYIDSIEICGERAQNECAISLYIVKKGEALWDVAKALLTDEETLVSLNTGLQLPLQGGEKVLLYREMD